MQAIVILDNQYGAIKAFIFRILSTGIQDYSIHSDSIWTLPMKQELIFNLLEHYANSAY